MIEWLKQHWFLFVALVTVGTAWGQNTAKISELENKLSKAETIIANQSRIDERTVILQQDMKEQRQILLELLATQRAWAQKNNIIVEQPAPVSTPRTNTQQKSK